MRTAIACALLLGTSLTHAVSIPEAKRIVAAGLKDPSTVQFRNVRAYKRTGAVCGEYNAKNSYGGYVGFAPFGIAADGAPMDAPQIDGLSPSYAQAALRIFLRECEGN